MIWEPRDIKVGMRVRAPGVKEIWMITYDPEVRDSMITYDPEVRDSGPGLGLVSLTDGMMARKHLTPIAMADFLNDCKCQPVALIGETD